MALFSRRPRLPADRRPPLARDERVLAWATIAETSDALVATNRGLWAPAGAGPGRLGWHEIHKAVWSGKELAVTPALVVAEHDGYVTVTDGPVRAYLLLAPGDLPHQVRARVTRSVAVTEHHLVPPSATSRGGGVRVVARRVPGIDGLAWAARLDPGADPADAELERAVAAIVDRARAATVTP